jgi:hypothetical protein
MVATVTVNDVLDGHVGLNIECLDRIYLNGYVPNLQMGGSPGGGFAGFRWMGRAASDHVDEADHPVRVGGGGWAQ